MVIDSVSRAAAGPAEEAGVSPEDGEAGQEEGEEDCRLPGAGSGTGHVRLRATGRAIAAPGEKAGIRRDAAVPERGRKRRVQFLQEPKADGTKKREKKAARRWVP